MLYCSSEMNICPILQAYVGVSTSGSFPRSWLITWLVNKITRYVSLVEQELSTLLEHLSSLSVFSGVRVTRSLVLYVCFIDRCLSFCTFSFGHCVVCSTSIYGFWLALWYLQTLLTKRSSRQFFVSKKAKFEIVPNVIELFPLVQFLVFIYI